MFAKKERNGNCHVSHGEVRNMIYGEYTHMRCKCGGIIGMYDKKHFTCEKCEKNYDVMDINSYDHLEVDDNTGWIFPMVRRSSL